MWIRSNSHSGNARSENPKGCIVLNSQQLLLFFLPSYGGLCPRSRARAISVVYSMCVQALLWRVLVPNTLELAHSNTWGETHICYLMKLLPLMFWVWVEVFLFLLTLCLFFLLFSDKWNEAKTLVFQNKYPDWMPHKLHMVCIIDLFSWELAKKSCWSQGRPSLISPRCQGCLWYFTCRLFASLLLGFVPFPSFLSCASFHHSQGVRVLWRADGNLFSPSEMTPPIVANTSGEEVSEPMRGMILPPKVSFVLQRGQKQAGIALPGQILVPVEPECLCVMNAAAAIPIPLPSAN